MMKRNIYFFFLIKIAFKQEEYAINGGFLENKSWWHLKMFLLRGQIIWIGDFLAVEITGTLQKSHCRENRNMQREIYIWKSVLNVRSE